MSHELNELYIEPEIYDVTVFYFICFAFKPQVSLVPRSRHSAVGNKVVITYQFRTNKAALYVGMYLPCSFLSLGPFCYSPRPYLILPGSKKRNKTQQIVADFYELVKGRFLYPQVIQKGLRFIG